MSLRAIRSQAFLKRLNERFVRTSCLVHSMKNVQQSNQLRAYAFKSNKIQYLTKEKQQESAILGYLDNPVQQDMINDLNQYSKNDKEIDFGTVKTMINKFMESFNPNDNSVESKIAIHNYFLRLLGKLEYDGIKRVSDDSVKISSTEPIPLNEIFSDQELADIFIWLFQLMLDKRKAPIQKCFNNKISKSIFSEIFMALKDSCKISNSIKARIYVYFNKFLIFHKFENQAVENLKKIISVVKSDGDYIQLEKCIYQETVDNIQNMGVLDPNVIYKMFSLFDNIENNELTLRWYELFIKNYKATINDNVDHLIILQQLENSNILYEFLKLTVKRNDIRVAKDIEFYSKMISLLMNNNLESENKLLLNKLSVFLKSEIFDKHTNLNISNETLCTIILANILDNDSNLVNEQLLRLVQKDEKMTKNVWDMVLSWKIYKSFGDSIKANESLVNEINEVSKLILKKDEENETQLEQSENGEFVLNLSFTDEDNLSYINVKTLNYFLIAACHADKSKNFIYSIIEFFNEKSIMCNEQTYSIILLNYINKHDTKSIQEFFQHSLDNGVQWDESTNEINNKILFKCVEFLFDNSKSFEQLKEAFEFFSKVKNFLEDFDTNVINSILVKFLQFNYVGDALELLDKEFISSEDNSTSKYFGKANEEDTFNIENKSLNARKINLNNKHSHKIFITLYEYLLKNKDSDICWLIYGTIHRCFFNVPFDTYLPVMKKFNELRRPDASLLIFQQMKKLNRLFGLPPPNQTHYTYLLETYGDMLYEEGVIELHTMLRMDIAVDKDIKLNNAILGAYTNLQDIIKCKNIFDEMLAIPNNNINAINSETINIMIKSHTYSGLPNVSTFWNNLSKIDYIPDASNYKQFIISNCYHGKTENALEILEEMEFNGLEVDNDIIKSIYSWTEDKEKRAELSEWLVNSDFSKIYENLLESGELENNSLVVKE